MPKPWPSSPIRRASGTRTPSKCTWAVGDPLRPILCSGAAALEPGRVARDQEGGHAARPLGAAAGQHGVEVGDATVGDPRLGAVKRPLVAVAHRAGAQAGRVGPGAGLGEAVRAQQVAAEHRRQMLGALLLGAELGDRVAGQRVHAGAEADREPDRGQLFEHLEIHLVGLSATAVLLRIRQTQQASRADGGEDVAREALRVLLLGGPGTDLPRGEVAGEAQQVAGLLGGQVTFDRLRAVGSHGGVLRCRALTSAGRGWGRAVGWDDPEPPVPRPGRGPG